MMGIKRRGFLASALAAVFAPFSLGKPAASEITIQGVKVPMLSHLHNPCDVTTDWLVYDDDGVWRVYRPEDSSPIIPSEEQSDATG